MLHTRCNVLHTRCNMLAAVPIRFRGCPTVLRSHVATQSAMLQHSVLRCNTFCYVATRSATLQHGLLRCNTFYVATRSAVPEAASLASYYGYYDASSDTRCRRGCAHAVCRMLQLHDLTTLIATLDSDRDARISLRELRHESPHFSRFSAALTAALSADDLSGVRLASRLVLCVSTKDCTGRYG